MLPGPPTRDFQLQRPAEESTNEYNKGEYAHTLERWAYGHRADDICGNQKLQPQQNRASEETSKPPIDPTLAAQESRDSKDKCQHNAHDNSNHARRLHGAASYLNPVLKIHGISLRTASHTGQMPLQYSRMFRPTAGDHSVTGFAVGEC